MSKRELQMRSYLETAKDPVAVNRDLADSLMEVFGFKRVDIQRKCTCKTCTHNSKIQGPCDDCDNFNRHE